MTSKAITKPGLMTIAAAALLVSSAGATMSATSPSSTSGTTSPGATSSTSAPQAAAPVLITIKDFKYTLPASVAPGAKIMVTNQDDQNHTVTSTPKGAFEVKVDGGGGTASFTAPTKPGSYEIVCDFHANMTATLVVK
jgi:plastocyanin